MGGSARVTVMLLVDRLHAGRSRDQLLQLAGGLDGRRFRVLTASIRDDIFVGAELAGLAHRSLSARGVWDAGCVFGLVAMLRREKVGIIHALSLPAGWLGTLAARLAGTPVRVITYRGECGYGVRGWFDRRVLKAVSAVITDSERSARQLVSLGADHSRISVIPDGLPDEAVTTNLRERDEVRSAYGVRDNSWLIGISAERLDDATLGQVLQAASIVRAEVPGTKFMFLGSGVRESELMRRAMILGLSGSMIAAGWQPETARFAGAMDVAVVPEDGATFGIQAMGLGRPIVATNVGANAELFPMGEVGFVVPPENALILAHAILEVMRHPEAVERMRKRGRQLFDERFTSRRMLTAYEELYSDLFEIRNAGEIGVREAADRAG